jgi:hypothetical protein
VISKYNKNMSVLNEATKMISDLKIFDLIPVILKDGQFRDTISHVHIYPI